MVRLKERKKIVRKPAQLRFQFLMVRLKAISIK